ncbi:MAG: 2-oxo acid dehydrogenase subunit E2 [Actinobacteria bacterium]|nr:2-oxo acid dehydrogenase subunit E2 [Actinomycetota bacterium]
MRKLIADRMLYSKQNIPHIILTSVMDVDTLIALREKIKDKVSAVYNTKITYTDFIIKACATVLAEQPNVNSSLVNENQIVYEDVNVGLAVAIESGLIVPTIYNADKLSVFEIAKRRTELIEKAKQGKLKIEEITNGTFTISNLGMFGIRIFTAIINPPQGAILMVGGVYKAPAFVGDRVEPKQFMEISVAVDHRIIDGADGARYLQRLKEIIENPELLLI